jgi:speckle-type POZ protein
MSTTIHGFHLFTVKEYSRLQAMDVGSHISSDTFTVGGYDWKIYFYPNGKEWRDNSDYVSVFLGLINHDGTNVEASLEFTLLDQSGKGKHYAKSSLNNRYTTPDRIWYV